MLNADALLPAYLRAVVRFARATGDIHALSAADVRLIALAHGLEVAAHGSGHLRDLPEVPVVQKKKVHDHKEVSQLLSYVVGGSQGGEPADFCCKLVSSSHKGTCKEGKRRAVLCFSSCVLQCVLSRSHSPTTAVQLPGWGAEGGDWAEIDRLNEEEIAAAEATLLGGGGGGADLREAVAAEDAEAGASRIATQVQQLTLEDARAATAAANGGNAASDNESEEEEEEEEEEWETAAKSSSSKRKQHRRDARKAAWEARTQAAADAAAAGQGEAESAGGDAANGDVADAAAVEVAEEAEQEGGQEEEEDACSLASDDDATATHTAAPYAGGDKGQQPVAAEGQHAAEEQQQQGGSSVCIITADFAMQNVIMQVCLPACLLVVISLLVVLLRAAFGHPRDSGQAILPRTSAAHTKKPVIVY
jgi:rRNA maturation endonuclease Nob1